MEYGPDVIMSISSRFPERIVLLCVCVSLCHTKVVNLLWQILNGTTSVNQVIRHVSYEIPLYVVEKVE